MRIHTWCCGIVVGLGACGGGSAPQAAERPVEPTGPSDPEFLPRIIDAVARLAVVPAGVDPTSVEGPMGCVRFAADGRVDSAKLKGPSADAAVDEAFVAALLAFDAARDAAPEPLPADLSARLARDPLCFRLRFDL